MPPALPFIGAFFAPEASFDAGLRLEQAGGQVAIFIVVSGHAPLRRVERSDVQAHLGIPHRVPIQCVRVAAWGASPKQRQPY